MLTTTYAAATSRGRAVARAAFAALALGGWQAQEAQATYGKVTVEKAVVGGTGGETFGFTPNLRTGLDASQITTAPFSLANGQSQTFNVERNENSDGSSVAGVTNRVTEDGRTGWTLSAAECHRRTYDPQAPGSAPTKADPVDDSAADLPARRLDLRVKLYEWVKCWVTNTNDAGSLELRKHLLPSSDVGRFDLLVDGAVRQTGAGEGGTTGVLVVPAGRHAIAEAGAGDLLSHYLRDAACRAGSGTGPTVGVIGASGGWTVDVARGADVVCTITNTRRATVVVEKVTDPAEGSPSFAFASGGSRGQALPAAATFALAGGQSLSREVDPGQSYAVREDADAASAQGYTLTSLGGDGCTASGASVVVTPQAGQTVTCTFVNTKDRAALTIEKHGPAVAYSGDRLDFTFVVGNTGNVALHDVAVQDDRCAPVTGPTGTVLAPGERWTYACSYTLTHALGDADPVVNVVTATAHDPHGSTVTATDDHATQVLHPAIGLAKTGPATAVAGSALTYALTVTNRGDVAFAEGAVGVSDLRCEAPPALTGKGDDLTPATLDPGDAWTYACRATTTVDEASVVNVADVRGTDANGREAAATASFTTTLTKPEQSVAPEAVVAARPAAAAAVPSTVAIPAKSPAGRRDGRVGVARLRGPVGCSTRATRAVVSGQRVARVVFRLDGRRVATVRKADRMGRWSTRVVASRLHLGAHRLTATVTFAAHSGTRTRTLRLSFSRCRTASVRPSFTG